MRKLTGACLLTLALTACTSNEPAAAPETTLAPPPVEVVETATPTPSPTEEAGPRHNARNNIPKKISEEAGILTQDGTEEQIVFVVDSIEPNFQCTGSYSSPSERGNFIAVSIRMTTGDLTDLGGSYYMNPADWQFIGSNDLTDTNIATTATYGCLADTEAFPSAIGPGQQYAGKIVFDVPEPSGILIYAPIGFVDGGWEWTF